MSKCAWCDNKDDLVKLAATEKDEIIYGAWICKDCLDAIREMADQIKYYMKTRDER